MMPVLLAAADSDPGSDPLSIGKWLLVLGALLWIANQAMEFWARIIGKQTDGITRSEFDDHKKETAKHVDDLWKVVKGLRGSVNSIHTDVATIRTLREANGDRLKEIAEKADETSDKVSRILGKLEGMP
jgi:hypothetical protein